MSACPASGSSSWRPSRYREAGHVRGRSRSSCALSIASTSSGWWRLNSAPQTRPTMAGAKRSCGNRAKVAAPGSPLAAACSANDPTDSHARRDHVTEIDLCQPWKSRSIADHEANHVALAGGRQTGQARHQRAIEACAEALSRFGPGGPSARPGRPIGNGRRGPRIMPPCRGSGGRPSPWPRPLGARCPPCGPPQSPAPRTHVERSFENRAPPRRRLLDAGTRPCGRHRPCHVFVPACGPVPSMRGPAGQAPPSAAAFSLVDLQAVCVD